MEATERLNLSPYGAGDLDALFAFHSDRRVGRYTFSPQTPAEAAQAYEAAEAFRAQWGAAPWVVRNSAGRVVGYGGLMIDSKDPAWGVEIVYVIDPAHWGHGYATEIAQAGLAFGFERLGLKRIVSFAHPDNAASNRVLRKVGFGFERYLPEMNRNFYSIGA